MNKKDVIKICLIDDHQIVRQGLKNLLEKIGGFQIVDEFDDGDVFIDSLPLNSNPDIYLLDYSMPNLNGIEVLKKLEQKTNEYRVILLTQHLDENIINDAFHYGARGFLHKNCTAQDLKFSIENIIKYGYNNISEILKRIRNYESKSILSIKPTLSDRELAFLNLVCNEEEYTYEQMAQIMDVSIKSIDVYRSHLFDRFNIKSKVGLVLFSYKYKITKPFL